MIEPPPLRAAPMVLLRGFHRGSSTVPSIAAVRSGKSPPPTAPARALSSSSSSSSSSSGGATPEEELQRQRRPPAPPLHPLVERARLRPASDHLSFDRTHLWHPYTSLSLRAPPAPVLPVASASGCRLLLEDPPGAELIDGMSSWWAAVHGYAHPEIDAAVRYQLEKMSHVMFGGLTHRPAVELAELLLAITPANLTRVFFADSGSVSVEVALKMALQYHRGRGRPERTKIVSVRGGYHGDTLGCMGVCDPVTGMHSAFRDVLPRNIFVSRPPCEQSKRLRPEGSRGCDGCTCSGDGTGHFMSLDASIRELERTLEAHSSEVAALILEPLVQGAGGMRFYPIEYLRRAREACVEFGALMICDEIATGFGRAGTNWEGGVDDGNGDGDGGIGGKMFASQVAGIRPDIMTVGKALTGGYMTLGAALTTEEMAEGVSAAPPSHSEGNAPLAFPLMHGPTFMANPLACAAAVASASMLLRPSSSAASSSASGQSSAPPMWQANVDHIESVLCSHLLPAASLPSVSDVRVSGAIGVIEMAHPLDAAAATQRCVELGAWLRPFGRLLYCMPPYIASEEELEAIAGAMVRLAEEAPGAGGGTDA